MELYDPRVIRAIKNKYGFQFSKSLGQNFLIDRQAVEGIVQGAGISREDLVLEIGPGIGVLTAEAAKHAGKVVAIEIDGNLIQILADTLSEYDNVKVIHENVVKIDLKSLISEEAGIEYKHVKVIGNLPYYITTAIIMKLLEDRLPVESITIMMQKEVAERIVTGPGSRTYGALSVAVQYYCTLDVVEEVPRECFMPAPKVDSTVLKLTLRKEPPVELLSEEMFFRCVKAGFSQRRKTLSNSLKQTGESRERILQCLETAGIDEKRRAETLSLAEFAALANAFVQKA